MHIDIRKEGALIDGFKPEYHWCGVGCCSGDTPTPPGPEPPGPDTGTVISSLTIVVADVITESGNASAIFSPVSADTLLVYSSSDEDLATIDRITGEITVNDNGFVTFCVKDLYSGLEDCKLVEVKIEEPGPGPEPGETGITSIEIIVADVITDEGMASAIYEPSNEEVSLYYTSSDPSYASIDPITGKIEVFQDGFVDFCVEDLLTGLKDCKEVEVKKSYWPCPETDEYVMKVVYYVTGTTRTLILNKTDGIVQMKFENGTVSTPTRYHRFNSIGYHTVYYTLNTNVLFKTFEGDNYTGIIPIVEVEIPTCIDTIGFACFWYCKLLSRVIIPCSVKNISTYGFYYCHSLKEIMLPSSLETIGESAFGWDDNLETITIPPSVKSIGNQAFEFCLKLKEANVLCNVKTLAQEGEENYWVDMFPRCDSLSAFTGPSASYDGRMLISNDKTAVAFAPAGLTGYTIPNSVLKVQSYCFYYVENILELTIPNSVKDIENYAFFACEHLERLTIGTGVQSIGVSAFGDARNLDYITIYAATAPVIDRYTFRIIGGVYSENRILRYPTGSDYSSWLSDEEAYLGFYEWTGQEINDI